MAELKQNQFGSSISEKELDSAHSTAQTARQRLETSQTNRISNQNSTPIVDVGVKDPSQHPELFKEYVPLLPESFTRLGFQDLIRRIACENQSTPSKKKEPSPSWTHLKSHIDSDEECVFLENQHSPIKNMTELSRNSERDSPLVLGKRISADTEERYHRQSSRIRPISRFDRYETGSFIEDEEADSVDEDGCSEIHNNSPPKQRPVDETTFSIDDLIALGHPIISETSIAPSKNSHQLLLPFVESPHQCCCEKYKCIDKKCVCARNGGKCSLSCGCKSCRNPDRLLTIRILLDEVVPSLREFVRVWPKFSIEVGQQIKRLYAVVRELVRTEISARITAIEKAEQAGQVSGQQSMSNLGGDQPTSKKKKKKKTAKKDKATELKLPAIEFKVRDISRLLPENIIHKHSESRGVGGLKDESNPSCTAEGDLGVIVGCLESEKTTAEKESAEPTECPQQSESGVRLSRGNSGAEVSNPPEQID